MELFWVAFALYYLSMPVKACFLYRSAKDSM